MKKSITTTRWTTLTEELATVPNGKLTLEYSYGEYYLVTTKVTKVPISNFYRLPAKAELQDVELSDGILKVMFSEEL